MNVRNRYLGRWIFALSWLIMFCVFACPAHAQTVQVPDVTGMSRADAENALQSAGLTVKNIVERETRFPEGLVLQQQPLGGMTVAKGTGIVLIVSKAKTAGSRPTVIAPPTAMDAAPAPPAQPARPAKPEKSTKERPSINYDELAARLKRYGITPQHQAVAGQEASGTVVSIQRPDGTPPTSPQDLAPGSTVVLQTSAGADYRPPKPGQEKTAAVPDVKNKTLPEAIQALQRDGFKTETLPQPSPQPEGTVLGLESDGHPLAPGQPETLGNLVSIIFAGKPDQAVQATSGSEIHPPAIIDFYYTGLTAGEQVDFKNVTLHWRVQNARAVRIDQYSVVGGEPQNKTVHQETLPAGDELVAINGQIVCALPGPTTFRLIAANRVGPVDKTITVSALRAPKILLFVTSKDAPQLPVFSDAQNVTMYQAMLKPHSLLMSPDPSQPTMTFYEKIWWAVDDLGDGAVNIRPVPGSVDAVGGLEIAYTEAIELKLTAHNSVGSASAVLKLEPPQPIIKKFVAVPNPVPGVHDIVTLSWATEHAGQVVLSPPGITEQPSGSYQTEMVEPLTFALRVIGPGGYVLKDLRVDVANYQRGIAAFTAVPSEVDYEAPVVLRYAIYGLDSRGRVELTSDPPMDWSTFQQGLEISSRIEGAFIVRLKRNTRFILTAESSSGERWSESVSVQVGQTPIIRKFMTDQVHFENDRLSGQLVWDVFNASRVTIEPDIGETTLQGSKKIYLDAPRLYRLTAYGTPADIVARDTLWTGNPEDLKAPPDIFSFTATPEIATAENNRIKLEWSGRGVMATIVEISNGQIRQTWKDLPVSGQLNVTPQDHSVYNLTLNTNQQLTMQPLAVEYQKLPTLFVGAVADTIVTGGSTLLLWKAGDLGSTGKVFAENRGEQLPMDTLRVSPRQTKTFRFIAKNEAGQVQASKTIYVRPPAPSVVFLKTPPAKMFRDENYGLSVQVTNADSIRIYEYPSVSVRNHLWSFRTNPNGTETINYGYRPLNNTPLSQPRHTKLEIEAWLWGDKVSILHEVEIYPNVDFVVIDPVITWSPTTPESNSGYNIQIRLTVKNIGKDLAPLPSGDQKLRAIVQFPELNEQNYAWAAEEMDSYNPEEDAIDWEQLMGDDDAGGFWHDLLDVFFELTTISFNVSLTEQGYSNRAVLDMQGDLTRWEAYKSVLKQDEIMLPALNPGRYTAYIVVDPDNLILETDKENNLTRVDFESFYREVIGDYSDTVDGNLGGLGDALIEGMYEEYGWEYNGIVIQFWYTLSLPEKK